MSSQIPVRIFRKAYYTVKDSTGHVMKTFTTYKAANEFKVVYGNSNWTIC